jgi:hypothetical protein
VRRFEQLERPRRRSFGVPILGQDNTGIDQVARDRVDAPGHRHRRLPDGDHNQPAVDIVAIPVQDKSVPIAAQVPNDRSLRLDGSNRRRVPALDQRRRLIDGDRHRLLPALPSCTLGISVLT